MKRHIVGFYCDPENDWVADLDCGHGQHVRHAPPFEDRPWTTTEAERYAKLGVMLNCVRCEDLELPQNFVAYKQTGIFDTDSVPAGLTSAHSTKAGVWAKIHVLEGRLRYVVAEPIRKEFVLDPTRIGIVAPEILHHVQPQGPVRFYVEFYHKG